MGMLKRLENIYAAAAFAEAGEFDTAREIMQTGLPLVVKLQALKQKVGLTVDELTSMAIALAEAGESDAAIEIMQEIEKRLEDVKMGCKKTISGAVFSAGMSRH